LYFVQVFMVAYRDKKVVSVFVRFRAPLQGPPPRALAAQGPGLSDLKETPVVRCTNKEMTVGE
jgi:hypothetical protein